IAHCQQSMQGHFVAQWLTFATVKVNSICSEADTPVQRKLILKKPFNINTGNTNTKQKMSTSEADTPVQQKSILKKPFKINTEVDNNIKLKPSQRPSEKPGPCVPGTTIKDNDSTVIIKRTPLEQKQKKEYEGDRHSAPSHSENPSVQIEDEIIDAQCSDYMSLMEAIEKDVQKAASEILEKYKCYYICRKKEQPHSLRRRQDKEMKPWKTYGTPISSVEHKIAALHVQPALAVYLDDFDDGVTWNSENKDPANDADLAFLTTLPNGHFKALTPTGLLLLKAEVTSLTIIMTNIWFLPILLLVSDDVNDIPNSIRIIWRSYKEASSKMNDGQILAIFTFSFIPPYPEDCDHYDPLHRRKNAVYGEQSPVASLEEIHRNTKHKRPTPLSLTPSKEDFSLNLKISALSNHYQMGLLLQQMGVGAETYSQTLYGESPYPQIPGNSE
ncbi:hypothetical protein STEG23_002843, partial [Scotinomys teguina]